MENRRLSNFKKLLLILIIPLFIGISNASEIIKLPPKEFVVFVTQFLGDNGKYGFDDFTIPNVPAKSVMIGDSDTVKIEITPDMVANSIYFRSTVPANVTVNPNNATSAAQIVTVTGVAKGDSEIQANVGSVDGYNFAKMKVTCYSRRTKTVAIRLVHEENDDIQVIPVGGGGGPDATCIQTGPNGVLDTVPAGDDEISMDVLGKEVIKNGPDSICNTKANNTNIFSTDINYAAVENFLKKVYNQAIFSWDVKRLPAMAVNFDLNKDRKLDTETWMSAEMQVIRDNCKDDNYDYNIFLVNNPSRGYSGGKMDFNKYGFVFVDVCLDAGSVITPESSVAHELGHGAFDLQHTHSDPGNIMYNIPEYWQLRKWQWDIINPNLGP